MIQYLPISVERLKVINGETAKDDISDTDKDNQRRMANKQKECTKRDGSLLLVPWWTNRAEQYCVQRRKSRDTWCIQMWYDAPSSLCTPLCRRMPEKSKGLPLLARYECADKEMHWSATSVDRWRWNNRENHSAHMNCLTDRFPCVYQSRLSLWILSQFSGRFICVLPDTKPSTLINKLKAHFGRQCIPEIVFSDNGSQYTST